MSSAARASGGIPAPLVALVVTLVVSALGGVACRTPVPRSPLAALPALPEDDPRATRYLSQQHARAAGREALRARTRVRIEGRAGARFSRQLLLVERPDRLRVEVLGLAGQRLAALATDGEIYDVFRAETGRIESGGVYPGILDEFVGVPITPAAGAALLLGVPELVHAEEIAGLDAGEGHVALQWWEAEQLHQAEFDALGHLVGLRIETALGAPSLEASWGDYRDLAGVPFAHRVTIAIPPAQVAAEVVFLEVELNPELAAELFRLGASRLSSPAEGD